MIAVIILVIAFGFADRSDLSDCHVIPIIVVDPITAYKDIRNEQIVPVAAKAKCLF